MANAYSILHQYDQPLYNPQVGLIAKVLDYKQNKYDVNRTKIQSALDNFDSLGYLKEQDGEYLDQRLEKFTNLANQFQNVDFSDDTVSSAILGNVSQFMDDKVKNIVYSKRIYDAEEAEWEKMRLDDKEAYSEANRRFARSARNNYMADAEVGAKYKGGGGFIEFVDVPAKIQENIPEIIKQLEAGSINTTYEDRGDGLIVDKVTRRAVPRNKMEMAIDNILGEKERAQMRINAWDSYSQMPEEGLKEQYQGLYNERVSGMESHIEDLKVYARANNKDLSSEIEASKKSLSEYKKTNAYDNVSSKYGRTTIENELYGDRLKSGFLNAYSYSDKIDKIEVDKSKLEIAKFHQDAKEHEDNLRYKYDALSTKGEGNKKSNASKGLNGLGDVGVVSTNIELQTDDKTAKQKYMEEKDKAQTDAFSLIKGDLTTDEKTNILAAVDKLDINTGEFSYTDKNGTVQKLDITQNNLGSALLKLQAFTSENENTQSLDEAYHNKAKLVATNLQKLLVGGGSTDFNLNEISNFPQFKIVNGKVVDLSPMEAKSFYKDLLSKSSLSEEEQHNLELASHLLILKDDDYDDDDAKLHAQSYNRVVSKFIEDPNEARKLTVNYTQLGDIKKNYGTDTQSIGTNGLTQSQTNLVVDTYKILRDEVKVLVDDNYKDSVVGSLYNNDWFNSDYEVQEFAADDVSQVLEIAKELGGIQPGSSDYINTKRKYDELLYDIKKAARIGGTSTSTIEVGFFDNDISDIKENDAEAVSKGKFSFVNIDGETVTVDQKEGDDISVGSFGDIITSGVTLGNKILEDSFKNLEQKGLTFSKEGQKETFTALGSLVSPESEIDLNNVERYQIYSNTEDPETAKMRVSLKGGFSRTVSVKVSDLETNGIVGKGELSNTNRYIYDASMGKSALSISLGTNKVSDKLLKNAENTNLNNAFNFVQQLREKYNPSIQQDQKYIDLATQATASIDNLTTQFNAGTLDFKLEPREGQYYMVMYDQQGNELHNTPAQKGAETVRLNDNNLQMIINNSVDLKDGVFLDYVEGVFADRLSRTANLPGVKEQRTSF